MILQVPDESVLSEIFQSAPTTDAIPQDGLWFYERTDKAGVTLQLSFNIFERSVQTVLRLSDRVLQTVSLEGAARLLDARDYRLPDTRTLALRAEFEYKNAVGVLDICLEPDIFVQWTMIENEQE